MAKMRFSERQAFYGRLERGIEPWETPQLVASVYGLKARTATQEEERRAAREARLGKPFGPDRSS
ncbi:hypothetical protein EPN42_05600 [bacterium]|nr:MAG: hypothetical protein EPN42_05600 [bacterium]